MTPHLTFGPQICGDLRAGATREWLVTDGLGGYAMGTVSGLRTRRYHGLLMVSGDTPAVRPAELSSRKGTGCSSASTWSAGCRGGAGGSATW
jgi:hypothetical protein